MRKPYPFLLVLLMALLVALPVTADNKITYDFDKEIGVEYAAEFTAVPVSETVYGWCYDAAGGSDKPLQVVYGVVNLKVLDSEGTFKEEFIKISGENFSERFLANSMTTGWYDEGEYTRLKFRKTFFWSAKKLEGSSVVKDFTLPIKSVTFKQNFDENLNLTSIEVWFSDEGDKENQIFWSDAVPEMNVYQADMSTLNYYGELSPGNGVLQDEKQN